MLGAFDSNRELLERTEIGVTSAAVGFAESGFIKKN